MHSCACRRVAIAELVAYLHVGRFSVYEFSMGWSNVHRGDESVVLHDKTSSGAEDACRMCERPMSEAVPRKLVEHVEHRVGDTLPGPGKQGFLGFNEVVLT